jgi:hypothetical protein
MIKFGGEGVVNIDNEDLDTLREEFTEIGGSAFAELAVAALVRVLIETNDGAVLETA